MASRPGAPPGPPPEQKKGEVNELRVLLRTVNTDKDSKRKRDVIKKVRSGGGGAGAAHRACARRDDGPAHRPAWPSPATAPTLAPSPPPRRSSRT